ncbi:hypothetical protein GRI44_12430 [Altererythrobacter confluentis]|uniref:HTH luxR-type domain-containing protein n=1 Tax=Allopontixanthobacter confluentis TaxID=1849021 RepID=A0A6L7GKZ7_9SPHN|nr:LuxR C-terminal-related transcriptional regulator [Allopontixanthobacter confluentis]MXP15558.1 hypothetical protein [Allopontixanthobacter confluentis]
MQCSHDEFLKKPGKNQLAGSAARRSRAADADTPEKNREPVGLQDLIDALTALDGRSRMVVRRDGTLIAGSSVLNELFETGTCLLLHADTVRTALPEYSDPFHELLQVNAPEVRNLALPYSKIDGHMILSATSLCKTAVCMSLQRATQMDQPELADLEDVFHLTKAEASIVYGLFMGHTPQQIAIELDNSIHTIRAHIRRCYDKLGITCREELWRKLNAYRLK